MKYITNQNQKKQEERKGSINPLAVAATGAAIGAGVAIASAVILKDKRNREKIGKALTNVKKQTVGYMKHVQNQAQDKKNEIGEKIAEGKEGVKKVIHIT